MQNPRFGQEVIGLYKDELLSCAQIATKVGVSRQAIFKYLRKQGVDTRKGFGTHKEIECFQCKGLFKRSRGQIKNKIHNFCSALCYYKYTRTSEYQQHRQGQRIGRRVAEEAMNNLIMMDVAVHHVDGDNDNNEKSNLWVFRSNADHVRYHRGGFSDAFILSAGEWKKVSRGA